MGKLWFPGIRDAEYWRKKRQIEAERQAVRNRKKRIAERGEPTDVFSTSWPGGALKLGRAGSQNPWYLEVTIGQVSDVQEVGRMSKKDAKNYLDAYAAVLGKPPDGP